MAVLPDPVGADALTVTRPSRTAVSVTFTGLPGFTYTVQRASSIRPANWQNLTVTNADGFGVFTVVEVNDGGANRFYRTVRGVAP